MKIKRIISLLLAACSLQLVANTALAYDEDIKVYINGTELEAADGVAPFLMNDRTMVPLRAISEGLGYDVYWNNSEESITIFDNSMVYAMWVGKDYGFGLMPCIKTYTKMDVPPTVVDDHTYIPLRAMSEIMPNVDVAYDEATNSVNVTASPLEEEVTEDAAEQLATYTSALGSKYDDYVAIYNGDEDARIYSTITLMDGREIKLELYPNIAPESVINYMRLASSQCFDEKIFHRVIDGFMIQGGAFDVEGNYYSSDPIQGEFFANNVVNFLSHDVGVVSMARAQDNNSGANQFFIVQAESDFLDGNYAAFGKVIEGQNVVDSIAKVKTDDEDKPIENVIIKTVTVDVPEKYSSVLTTPVQLTETEASTIESQSNPTVEEFATTQLGMTYVEFIQKSGVDTSLASPTMKFADFEKLIPIGNYVSLFFNCTFKEFLDYYGIPENKVSTETTFGDLINIIQGE